jgi:phosphatidylserine/phosphatidylglycerophosphate/cardiolipin synthase-like enzyme
MLEFIGSIKYTLLMKIKYSLIFLSVFLLFPLLSFSQTQIPQGASYELGFSPGWTSLTVVLKAINASKSTLLVACYEFTSRDIAEGIEKAAHRGVKVRIVADAKAAKDKYSQISILRSAGVPIRLDAHYAIHHHKFLVIDLSSIETGSFNFTSSAISRNAENALVLWNVPNLALDYSREFERLWGESPLEGSHD